MKPHRLAGPLKWVPVLLSVGLSVTLAQNYRPSNSFRKRVLGDQHSEYLTPSPQLLQGQQGWIEDMDTGESNKRIDYRQSVFICAQTFFNKRTMPNQKRDLNDP